MMESLHGKRSEKASGASRDGSENDDCSVLAIGGVRAEEGEHNERPGKRAAESAHWPTPKQGMPWNEQVEREKDKEPRSENECC